MHTQGMTTPRALPRPVTSLLCVATRLRHVAGCSACRDLHLRRTEKLRPVW